MDLCERVSITTDAQATMESHFGHMNGLNMELVQNLYSINMAIFIRLLT